MIRSIGKPNAFSDASIDDLLFDLPGGFGGQSLEQVGSLVDAALCGLVDSRGFKDAGEIDLSVYRGRQVSRKRQFRWKLGTLLVGVLGDQILGGFRPRGLVLHHEPSKHGGSEAFFLFHLEGHATKTNARNQRNLGL